jgi:predicted DCC family thiol-disulfide oxidoreductase YuxK
VHALLYDAKCPFCRLSMAVLLAWDRRHRLRPVALQDPEASSLTRTLSRDERFGSWHLVTPAGELRSGGAAVAPLLRELRGGGWLAWLSERFPRATDSGHRWISQRRSALSPRIPRAVRRRVDDRIASRTKAGGSSSTSRGTAHA